MCKVSTLLLVEKVFNKSAFCVQKKKKKKEIPVTLVSLLRLHHPQNPFNSQWKWKAVTWSAWYLKHKLWLQHQQTRCFGCGNGTWRFSRGWGYIILDMHISLTSVSPRCPKVVFISPLHSARGKQKSLACSALTKINPVNLLCNCRDATHWEMNMV